MQKPLFYMEELDVCLIKLQDHIIKSLKEIMIFEFLPPPCEIKAIWGEICKTAYRWDCPLVYLKLIAFLAVWARGQRASPHRAAQAYWPKEKKKNSWIK